MYDIKLSIKNKIKEFSLFIFFFLLLQIQLFSQVAFSRSNIMLEDVYSRIAVMTDDMNNDQQDDLVFFENSNTIVVQLNNGLEKKWRRIAGPAVGNCWAGLVADFNNDGYKEIVAGVAFGPIRIYTFNHHTETFSLFWQAPNGYFTQNMNAVDINNDGFLDLFVCNDDGDNYFYINQGGLDLIEEDVIDFNTIPVSDNSGNYGSIFTDFDQDGDLDLYIAKCRINAAFPTDPRRINQLYRNDGNGNFEEVAKSFNLASGAQTWVANFADLDLDGDLDAIFANHNADLQLMENVENDTFVEVQENSGIELKDDFWQISFWDLDNDGYKDVIISASDIFYYHNNGDLTFTKSFFVESFDNSRVFSTTIGDYNNDGFYDMCLGYGYFDKIGDTPDSIWLNDGNNNNWIDFRLEGVDDNLDAVGVKIEVFSNGLKQMNYIEAGHSYGIMNSKKLHFGLGLYALDSVKIFWTNGEQEVLFDLQTNVTHYIKQGVCRGLVEAAVVDDEDLCVGDHLEIEYDGNGFIDWSNGDDNPEISYPDETLIYANYNVGDCDLEAWKIYPFFGDTFTVNNQFVVQEGILQPCPNDSILVVISGEDIVWSNGFEGDEYLSIVEEEFGVSYTDGCVSYIEAYQRENLTSDFVIPPSFIQYTSGENVTINVSSESAQWFNNEMDVDPFYKGSEYVFENIIEPFGIFIRDVFENLYQSTVGYIVPENASFPSNNANPIITFEVYETLVLKSVEAFTTVAGDREIQIFNTDIVPFFTDTIFFDSDNSLIEMNITLPPGSYYIRTNHEVNQFNFGVSGPIFLRQTEEEDIFPMTDDLSTISITGNTYGNNNTFYSFYNWIVENPSKTCRGDLFHVVMEDVDGIEEKENNSLKINNPVIDYINLDLDESGDAMILNLNGQVELKFYHEYHSKVNIESLNSGYYILVINGKRKSFIKI